MPHNIKYVAYLNQTNKNNQMSYDEIEQKKQIFLHQRSVKHSRSFLKQNVGDFIKLEHLESGAAIHSNQLASYFSLFNWALAIKLGSCSLHSPVVVNPPQCIHKTFIKVKNNSTGENPA